MGLAIGGASANHSWMRILDNHGESSCFCDSNAIQNRNSFESNSSSCDSNSIQNRNSFECSSSSYDRNAMPDRNISGRSFSNNGFYNGNSASLYKESNSSSYSRNAMPDRNISGRSFSNKDYDYYKKNNIFAEAHEYPTKKLTSGVQPFNIEEKNGGMNMSFVGITFANDRIIAYGDTKSSRQTANGLIPDYGHEEVKKIFKNNFFIAACYGTNQFFVQHDNDMRLLSLEEWMHMNMEHFEDPLDLCVALKDKISDNMRNDNDNVSILFGRKKQFHNGRQCLLYGAATISRGFVVYKEELVNGAIAAFGGDQNYVNYFKQHNEVLVRLDHDSIRESINYAIKYLGNYVYGGKYNPVGGPIQVLEL